MCLGFLHRHKYLTLYSHDFDDRTGAAVPINLTQRFASAMYIVAELPESLKHLSSSNSVSRNTDYFTEYFSDRLGKLFLTSLHILLLIQLDRRSVRTYRGAHSKSLGREWCPSPLWSLGLDRKRIARPDHTVGSGDSEDGYNCNLELVGQFVGEGAKSQGGPGTPITAPTMIRTIILCRSVAMSW